MSQETNLQRVEAGRRSTLLVKIGIPPVYHGEKASPKVTERLERFLSRAVAGFDSALLLTGPRSEDSYRVGAILAEMAADLKISVAVIGFRALLNVYKSSFRDPDARALLHDKFGYSDLLVFANVNEQNYGAWGDIRDVTWFRGIIKQRASMKKKTVFCLEKSFSIEQLRSLLGPENAPLLANNIATCILVGEGKNGADR